jgi:hypothetical protein
MWEPRRLTTLWASTARYRNSFTFYVHLTFHYYCSATWLTNVSFSASRLNNENAFKPHISKLVCAISGIWILGFSFLKTPLIPNGNVKLREKVYSTCSDRFTCHCVTILIRPQVTIARTSGLHHGTAIGHQKYHVLSIWNILAGASWTRGDYLTENQVACVQWDLQPGDLGFHHMIIFLTMM